jgi:hypothetical protein
MKTLTSKVMLLLGTALMTAVPLAADKIAHAQSEQFIGDRVASGAIAQDPSISEPISERQQPSAYLFPIDGAVNVTLINNSPSRVSYMMPGMGNMRMLEAGQSVAIRATDFPVQIGFTQLDGGFTSAEVTSVSPDRNSVSIEFDHVSSPLSAMRSIVVSDNGYLYLN